MAKLLKETFHKYLHTNKVGFYQLRTSSFDSNQPKDEVDVLSYVRMDNEFKLGITSAIRKLEQLFGANNYDVMKMVMEHKILTKVPGFLISDNYKICKQNNVSDEKILECVYILGEELLLEKLNILRNVNCDINIILPFVKLNTSDLFTYVLDNGDTIAHRISALSKLLQVSQCDICEYMMKRKFLFTLDLERIETISNILFDNGVTPDQILRDTWILRYSEDLIFKRLEFMKSHNISKVKTWMFRINNKIFHKYRQRIQENQSVLGNKSRDEYFAQKLDCTLEQAKGLSEKYPILKTTNMKRLEEIIDWLYSNGYTPIHIIRNPKILFCNIDTIKARFKQLTAQEIQVDSLHVLSKSQRQFDEYYKTHSVKKD